MAFPKKGTRNITVRGESFLWRVRKNISHNERHGESIGIPIQHISEGSILIAEFGYCRSGYIDRPVFSITPSLIEMCIELAIKNGWDFDKKGKSFVLDCKELLSN